MVGALMLPTHGKISYITVGCSLDLKLQIGFAAMGAFYEINPDYLLECMGEVRQITQTQSTEGFNDKCKQLTWALKQIRIEFHHVSH